MTIRQAESRDVEALIRLRLDFLQDEGVALTAEEAADIAARFRQYLQTAMPGGGFIAIIAEEEGAAVSTAFASLAERPARKAFVPCTVGMPHNVFTYPAYRRRGIATRVVNALTDAARQAGAGCMDLLATEAGVPLYAKLGFRKINMQPMRRDL